MYNITPMFVIHLANNDYYLILLNFIHTYIRVYKRYNHIVTT